MTKMAEQGSVIIDDTEADSGQRSIFPISILTSMPDSGVIEITKAHQDMVANGPASNEDEIEISDERCGTDIKPYVCPDCHKTFSKKRYLRSHLRVHRHRGSFPCSICGTLFTYRCNLYRHTKKHYAEKNVACEFCDEKFVNKRALILHGKIHRGQKQKVKASQPLHNLECKECGRVFHRHFDIVLHARIHTGEKPFSCEVCGRGFSHKGNMTRHVKTHERVDGVYQCRVCGKTLTSQKNYENHMEVHFGKKEYLCHVCGRRFSTAAGLAIHGKIHRKEARQMEQMEEEDMIINIMWSKNPNDTDVQCAQSEAGTEGEHDADNIVAEILDSDDVRRPRKFCQKKLAIL